MKKEILDYIKDDVKKRFLNYVKINTEADEKSGKKPSSEGQWDLAILLEKELLELGLSQVIASDTCYVYGTLPKSPGATGCSLTLCAHMDTSPSEPGSDVKPIIHENYDGGPIRFPDDPDLLLTPEESPDLKDYIGHNIITASGKTLLGADDKAGIAEIMATLAAFKKFPELMHPELKIVFTRDEEIGAGVDDIDMERVGEIAYTVDGSLLGYYECECFDAYGAEITFTGMNVHPGSAKNIMVNASAIAARFFSMIPEQETPEHTEKKEGFYHLIGIKGDESNSVFNLIIRDFDNEKNLKRIKYLENLIDLFKVRYPGLHINMTVKDQYRNMKEVIGNYPDLIAGARGAIKKAGLVPREEAIRGGTDGARLSFMGVPTPNLFTGGYMFHSRKEWISEYGLQKTTEVLINLCEIYSKSK